MFDYGTDKSYGFEEVESTAFLRWARSPLNCNAGRRNQTECLSSADAIVVPSACATCFQDVTRSSGCYGREGEINNCTINHCADVPLLRHWAHLRRRVDHLFERVPRRVAPPLVVMHAFASWGDFFNTAVIRTLAAQPSAFVARVVIVTIEEPWGRWPYYARWFGHRPRPTFVVVPYSIHTASVVESTRERGRRPFAALFQGRPFASFDGARMKFLEQMMAAGGFCDRADWRTAETNVVCVLCDRAEGRAEGEGCRQIFNATAALCEGAESWGGCAVGSLSFAAHSTFCIEPTSDDLMRSHFYLAAQSGCIPVIFDGSGDVGSPKGQGGMTGVVRLPTRWAWRQEELQALITRRGGDDGFARRANYSAFALPFFAADLMYDKLPGLARHLLMLATKPAHAPWLAATRRALDAAAPLMRWAPPGARCKEAPCDAFSALAATVHALRWAQHGVQHGAQQGAQQGA